MLNKDLISVIVPVYNVEEYLENCLNSIAQQTYSNIETIIVDDGSTDGSPEICDEFCHRHGKMRVIHKDNGGLSNARNTGLKYAKGKYVLFVDSDDCISEILIEHLYNQIIQYKAEIAICDPVHVYDQKQVRYKTNSTRRIFKPREAIEEMLYQKSFLVSACGKLYLTELFKEINFPEGLLFEDSATMYLLFEKTDRIVYSNAKLYGYVHRDNSITTKRFSEKDLDILKICNEIDNHFKHDLALSKAARSYHMAAALRIYLNLQSNSAYDKEIISCKQYIEENIAATLRDKKIRNKMKFALLLYRYGQRLMPIIYKRVNRWS